VFTIGKCFARVAYLFFIFAVIYSCVRAGGKESGIGFLSDVQRMNVALTRSIPYIIFTSLAVHFLVLTFALVNVSAGQSTFFSSLQGDDQ
jgi:hypothetical protein